MSTEEARVLDDGALELLTAATPIRRWLERRPVVLGAAALLFIVTFALRELVASDRGVMVGLLYVIPVALVGLELGLRAGVAASAGTLLLVALQPSSSDPALDALGLATRGIALGAVGVLAGRFSDRMRAVQSHQEHLLRSGLELAQLAEPDTLAQMLARHVRQAVDVAHVRVELTGAPMVAFGAPAEDSLCLPISSPQSQFGTLQVSASAKHSLRSEERLMLATLALQAAVAADNHRLLAAERERVALQTDLLFMRQRLQDQFRNAGHILDLHERERRGIADQLHEQAAQAMAAALLVVGRLERDIVDELTQAQLEKVRHSVRDCIAELRGLAGSLRSPMLEELGLLPTLERLFEREQEERSRSIDFRAPESLSRLPADVEVSAYRLVEEALSAIPAALKVRIEVDEGAQKLLIAIESDDFEGGPEELRTNLTTTRARLEMVGGSLETSRLGQGVALAAELPLTSWLEPLLDGVKDTPGGHLSLHDALRHPHPPVG
jgi:signal transduction histidine kinase